MWYTIKGGKHRASPLNLGIHFGKTKQSYQVIFDYSCAYDLRGVDQEDTNKLCGWSYGWHKENSIRVGWEYNTDTGRIELNLYVYKDGVRIESEAVAEVELNKKIDLILKTDEVDTLLIVVQRDSNRGKIIRINETFKPTWGYKLGTYFGGNRVSPYDMKIYLKEVKPLLLVKMK